MCSSDSPVSSSARCDLPGAKTTSVACGRARQSSTIIFRFGSAYTQREKILIAMLLIFTASPRCAKYKIWHKFHVNLLKSRGKKETSPRTLMRAIFFSLLSKRLSLSFGSVCDAAGSLASKGQMNIYGVEDTPMLLYKLQSLFICAIMSAFRGGSCGRVERAQSAIVT
jgi:hypothetical protein